MLYITNNIEPVLLYITNNIESMEGITQDDPLATKQKQRVDKRLIEELTSKGKKVAKKADKANEMTTGKGTV